VYFDFTRCKGMHRFSRDIFIPLVLVTDTVHVVVSGDVTSCCLGGFLEM
jgi:hypothetical protein